MDMCKVSSVQELIELMDSEMPWSERVAICDAVPLDFISAHAQELAVYYHGLDKQKKIWGILDYERLLHMDDCIENWDQWSAALHCLGHIVPTEITLPCDRIMRRGGFSCWREWIELFSRDKEIAAVLSVSNASFEELLELMEAASTQTTSPRVRSLLFFHLVWSDKTEVEPFLAAVSRHKECLRPFVIGVLCDFFFRTRYPRQMPIYKGLMELYADPKTIKEISDRPHDKGTMFAWSALLCGCDDPDSEENTKFRGAYIEWVRAEKTYQFVENSINSKSETNSNEWDFLRCLCSLTYDDQSTVDILKELWLKKAEIYYGWKEPGDHSQWGIHLGLLLWGIGTIHVQEKNDISLLIYIMEKLNGYITSALAESAYYYLLLEIFSFEFPADPQVQTLLKSLSQKVYSLELLCEVINYYLDTSSVDYTVLKSMQQHLVNLHTFYGHQVEPMEKEIERLKNL